MENNEPMCYITYAVPANLMPKLSLEGAVVSPQIAPIPRDEESPALYPPGFMPDWFLRGSFPEDDFED